MPAKKIKTKSTKKIAKTTAKKTVAKKPVKKSLPEAKATKAVKKSKTTKVVKKSKSTKTVVKKPVKQTSKTKTQKKAQPKKTTTKKTTTKKPSKKSVETKNKKDSTKHSLAKKILAKTNRPEKEIEIPKEPEKKKDHLQKMIIVRKTEGRSKVSFKIGEYAVYPSHGVGKVVGIETSMVLGQELNCYLMHFEVEKLNIKIPANSAEKIGLRHLTSKTQMDEVFSILRSGVKKLKGMWSRRAQEYETKINSGDIILLAEVLRDLTRDIEDSERSYSERIIYETAIYRLASEYSVIYGITIEEAQEKVIATAKDKLNSEGKVVKDDDFDDFDDFDDDSSDEDDEDEDEDDDDDYEDDDDDYDDDKPKRRKSKK